MTTEYQVNYFTHNKYEAPVTEALFEFMVAPCKDKSQVVNHISYQNSLGAELFFYKNTFGFQVARLRSTKSFTDFRFSMEVNVEKKTGNIFDITSLPLEEEQAILASRSFYIDHHLFLGFTKYTTIFKEQVIYFKDPSQPVFDYLIKLNKVVYGLLKFDPDPTDVHTTAGEALQIKKGVCQDYAHLFLSMARHSKIPCRYVSGYLNQGGSLVGSAVMHAWVEAYVPGCGWCGFDPTNNLLADHNYIKAAHGVDYSDCSPIKGVLKTKGNNETTYEVKVVQNQIASEAQ